MPVSQPSEWQREFSRFDKIQAELLEQRHATEAVTGKISGDRVAVSGTTSAELRDEARVDGAVVKRIASAARGEDPS